MSIFAALMIWFFPGCVFALHQGIDHARGVHIPQMIVFNREVQHWIIYVLVLLLGPVILLALLAQTIASAR